MDDEDGMVVIFDEVYMQDMIDEWSKLYAEGFMVDHWYYDCRTSTVIIRLSVKETDNDRD
jgi:hypothetical protein